MSVYVSLINADVALKSYNLASSSKTTTPSKHGSYIAYVPRCVYPDYIVYIAYISNNNSNVSNKRTTSA
jgi:hypothetical protein